MVRVSVSIGPTADHPTPRFVTRLYTQAITTSNEVTDYTVASNDNKTIILDVIHRPQSGSGIG